MVDWAISSENVKSKSLKSDNSMDWTAIFSKNPKSPIPPVYKKSSWGLDGIALLS